MTHQQLDILTKRLECLEYKVEEYRKTSRRWRTIGCCATASLVLILLIGATDKREEIQEEIRARRIVLVDLSDKERVKLSGDLGLSFYNEKGDRVITLEEQPLGPELTLARNKKRITISIQEQDVSGGGKRDELVLSLLGAQSNAGLSVYEEREESGENDPAGKISYSASSVTLSHSKPIAQKKEMGRSIRLAVSPSNASLSFTKGLRVYGTGPEVAKALEQYALTKDRAELTMDADGSGRLTLSDNEGRPRAVLGSIDLEQYQSETVLKRPTSSLVLFGKDGKVLWKAP